uniref:RNA-dependent RNA polymerase n=1 Tax=Varroa destructor virus 3/5 TaxID=2873539 RepID=A0A8K1QZ57_9VIRU|nr:MAG: RNA-dependent RNA polymerase [Varroa destructor virus 3/5]
MFGLCGRPSVRSRCCGKLHCMKDLWIPLRNTRKATKNKLAGVVFDVHTLAKVFGVEGFESQFQYPMPNSVDAPRYLGTSLCYHARLALKSRSGLQPPTKNEMDAILDDVERVYGSTRVLWHDFEEVDDDMMAEFISKLDRDASPGYPWKDEAPTNEVLFGLDAAHLPHNYTNVMRVKEAVNARLRALRLGVVEADNINVFIKQEPHKMKKVDVGAWRLIQGVGLTDNLVDRFLFTHWFEALIEKNRKVPSKPGWAPIKGGFKWLAGQFRRPMMADKSGWDWTVQEWHVEFLKRFIPRMIIGVPEILVCSRIEALFTNCRWQLADTVIMQNVTGVQKSGCFGTIAFNSLWQFAVHALACHRLGWSLERLGNFACLGDDTLQECVPDVPAYENEVAKTGAIVKTSEISDVKDPKSEFAGFKFDKSTCLPVYGAKHAFTLYHVNEDDAPETLASYLLNYGMHEDISNFLRRELIRRGYPEFALSKDLLNHFWTGLE